MAEPTCASYGRAEAGRHSSSSPPFTSPSYDESRVPILCWVNRELLRNPARRLPWTRTGHPMEWKSTLGCHFTPSQGPRVQGPVCYPLSCHFTPCQGPWVQGPTRYPLSCHFTPYQGPRVQGSVCYPLSCHSPHARDPGPGLSVLSTKLSFTPCQGPRSKARYAIH